MSGARDDGGIKAKQQAAQGANRSGFGEIGVHREEPVEKKFT
jgi:hypothetical protein